MAAAASLAADGPAAAPDYNKHVAPIFKKYCTGCHNATDKEGELVLERYAALLAGGGRGAVVVPGKSDQSRLVLVLTGKAKPAMPPDDNEKPTPAEIATLAAWIDAGAKGPEGAEPDPTILVTPKIKPAGNVRESVASVAFAPDGKTLALARFNSVELLALPGRSLARTLGPHRGRVNAVSFSKDGGTLLSAAGEPGVFGEVRLWNVADGQLVRTFQGHQDSLYAAVLSPDGKILATSSYDQQIKLWDAASGKELRTLAGHNDAVFDLAFRPDGKILASASGDRTVKLWDVASGERLDTFGQPLKELYAVAFSPDGKRRGRRRRRQSHPRVANQRRGEGKHESDPPLAVCPRRGRGQSGLFSRRQNDCLGRRRSDRQDLGRRSPYRAAGTGTAKRLGPGVGDQPRRQEYRGRPVGRQPGIL